MENKNWVVEALDDGYGDFKYNSTGKPDLIPSFVSTFKEKSEEYVNKELKYVASEINGYKYVVGDYAIKLDSNIRWTGGENKHNDKNFPILFKTCLGLMSQTNRKEVDILLMNLPIKYYTDDRIKLLTRITKGTHEVAISFDGKNFNRKVITIHDVVIKRQPFGSLCELMLNGNGDIEDYELAKGFNVLVDIGARTLNIMTLNSLDMVPELTTHTSDGMYSSYLQVGRYLENEFGGLIPDGKLPLIMKEKQLRGRDLTSLIDQVYENQANIIINTLDKLLINSWNFVDNVIFTGGGAEILKTYFDKDLYGVNKLFLDRYANVKGLRKYGIRLAKKRKKSLSPSNTIRAQIGSRHY